MNKIFKVALITLIFILIGCSQGSVEANQSKEVMHIKDRFTVGDSIYNNGFNLTLLSVENNGNKVNIEVEITNIANEHKFINNNFFTVTVESGEVIKNNAKESVIQVSKGKKISLSLTFDTKVIKQVNYHNLNSDIATVWDL